jgi:hypothetical protein
VKLKVVLPFNITLDTAKLLLIVGGETTVTVAVFEVVPVPPSVEVIAPVVLFFTPAVVPVTVTLKVQLPLAATLPALSAIVLGFVVVNVPPHCALEDVATVRPAGNVSLKATPLSATVVLGLVTVKVKVVVPFILMVDAPKLLLTVGGATTVTVAVLDVVPVPPSVEVIASVVLFFTPAVEPVTVTLKEHVPPAATLAPLKAITPVPAVVVNVPPQRAFDDVGTVNPAGRVSLKATPESATVALGLVMVKVNVVLFPNVILDAAKLLLMVGGATTVTVAVLDVVPAPLWVEVIAPVVLFFTPAVEPVTVTLKEHEPLAARLPPLRAISPVPAVVVTVPPHCGLDESAIVKPAGKMSVKAIPERATVVLGLVIVKVNVVLLPKITVAAPKLLLTVGGATTVSVSLAVAGVGSDVPLGGVAVNVLVTNPLEAVMVTCTVKVMTPPLGRVGTTTVPASRLAIDICPAPAPTVGQTAPPPAPQAPIDALLMPVAAASRSVALSAEFGPLFVKVNV